MDQTRFDDLTRALGGAATRRAGLKAALGGLLGAGLGSLAPTAGEASKKTRRAARCGPDKPCPDGQVCDGEGTTAARCLCADGQRPCNGVCCPSGQRCDDDARNPVCRCVSDGRRACNGDCCTAGDVCFVDRCQACSRPAAACQLDGHCCDAGRCDSGRCCLPKGAACTRSEHCCNYARFMCVDGRCEQVGGGGKG